MTNHEPTPLERLLTEERNKLRDIIEEQKGTIRALNIALGGEDSTSTENLIEAHGVDPNNVGLIALADALRAGGKNLERTIARDTRTIGELDGKLRSYKLLTESQERRIFYLTENCRGLDEARSTLESERSANEALTLENAQRAERIAELEREVDEYDAALLASDADLMKADDQAKAIAMAVMTDQVSNDSHALFIAAIRDLAAINEALGCDPDDGGAVPVIEAIDELKERIADQADALAKAREALESAKVFIRNGVALGFIRMPDADTPDPAHQTPVKIDNALAAIVALGQHERKESLDE